MCVCGVGGGGGGGRGGDLCKVVSTIFISHLLYSCAKSSILSIIAINFI